MKKTPNWRLFLGRGIGGLLLMWIAAGCATSARHTAYLQELETHRINTDVYSKAEQFKPLTLRDIEHMLSQEVPEETILYHLQKTRTIYQLTAEDVDRLRAAGASDDLVDYLLSTPRKYQPVYPLYYYSYPYYGSPYYWGYPYAFPYRPYYFSPPYYPRYSHPPHGGLRHRHLP